MKTYEIFKLFAAEQRNGCNKILINLCKKDNPTSTYFGLLPREIVSYFLEFIFRADIIAPIKAVLDLDFAVLNRKEYYLRCVYSSKFWLFNEPHIHDVIHVPVFNFEKIVENRQSYLGSFINDFLFDFIGRYKNAECPHDISIIVKLMFGFIKRFACNITTKSAIYQLRYLQSILNIYLGVSTRHGCIISAPLQSNANHLIAYWLMHKLMRKFDSFPFAVRTLFSTRSSFIIYNMRWSASKLQHAMPLELYLSGANNRWCYFANFLRSSATWFRIECPSLQYSN